LGFVTSFLFFGQFISPIFSAPIISKLGTPYTFIILGGTLYVVAILLFIQRIFTFLKTSKLKS